MTTKLKWVRRVNQDARERGATGAVLQFENLSTQAQYALPYDLAASVIGSGDRVLDWGCGNGHFSIFLEMLGASVTGFSFEPPPRAMALSRAFRFVGGNVSEPRRLPFADESFDAAVSVGVLEHVWETGGDEAASLAELHRVTRRGGVLLTFHFPNADGWIEKVVHALRLKKHFHHRKYRADDIRRLWSEAGFEIMQMRRYNALPRAELRHLPRALKDSALFAAAYDALDNFIAAVAPRVCTNYAVVARRL